MKDQRMIRARRTPGFTILEILIVLAVIAILAVMAVPNFRGMQSESWKEKAKGDLRILKAAVESYDMNTGSYPVATAASNRTISTNWQGRLMSAKPAIIEKILNDPFTAGGSTPYRYVLSTDDETQANFYLIWSVGLDGVTSITGIDNATGAIIGSAGDDFITTNTK